MKNLFTLLFLTFIASPLFGQADVKNTEDNYVLIYCADAETHEWNNTLEVEEKETTAYKCGSDGQKMVIDQDLELTGDFNAQLKSYLLELFEEDIINLEVRTTNEDGTAWYFEFTTSDGVERSGLISNFN